MATLFLTCAVLGAVVLVAQLVLSTLGAEHHAVGGHDAASDGLQLLSARALSAGVGFFGIGGLGARAAGLPTPLALVGAAALGLVAMVGVAAAMRSMLRLQRDGSIRIERAIGEAAVVYVPIPAALGGVGKVSLTLQGRIVEYQAMTPDGSTLPTGTPVVVVDVRGHDTVEVVPLPTLDGVAE